MTTRINAATTRQAQRFTTNPPADYTGPERRKPLQPETIVHLRDTLAILIHKNGSYQPICSICDWQGTPTPQIDAADHEMSLHQEDHDAHEHTLDTAEGQGRR